MVLCGPHLSTTTPKKKSIASSRRSVLSLRTRPNFSGHVDGTAGRKSAGSWSCLRAAFGSRARGAQAKSEPKAPDDDRHCRGDRSGLFLGGGLTIQLAGPGVIISYLIGAAIAAVIAYCLAEMAVVHSFSGSFGIYAESYLSRWAMLQWARRPECPHRRHQTRTGSKWASLRRRAPRRRNGRHAFRWLARRPTRCHRID